MPVLRLLFAGLIALAALAAGLFAALLLFVTGLIAMVARGFQGKSRPTPPGGPAQTQSPRRPTMRTDDAIDVVTTKVPPDASEQGDRVD